VTKYKVTFEIDTDAPRVVIEEVMDRMQVQLEALNDGSFSDDDGRPVSYEYILKPELRVK
jgi:hypothetical protein